jgi:hypothetical protein
MTCWACLGFYHAFRRHLPSFNLTRPLENAERDNFFESDNFIFNSKVSFPRQLFRNTLSLTRNSRGREARASFLTDHLCFSALAVPKPVCSSTRQDLTHISNTRSATTFQNDKIVFPAPFGFHPLAIRLVKFQARIFNTRSAKFSKKQPREKSRSFAPNIFPIVNTKRPTPELTRAERQRQFTSGQAP